MEWKQPQYQGIEMHLLERLAQMEEEVGFVLLLIELNQGNQEIP